MHDGVQIRTIGYGARSIDEFMDAIQAVGAEYLVDVRSAPYSRYKPEFSREPLAARLEQSGVQYVFMGDAWESGHRIVLMCSEGKPEECHRTKLVAEELIAAGVPVVHIDENGRSRSHRVIMDLIPDGQGTLFGEHAAAATSRRKHRIAS